MMRGTARLLFLVLIAVMVGANIPITTPTSEPATDLGIEEGRASFVVGEDGEGLTYEDHVATASDVVNIMDSCGVYDPSTNYNVVFDGLGTGLAPPTEEEYADMVGTANIVADVALAPGGELPEMVDWSTSPYMPASDSQGGQGSCAAWAVSYYANGFLQAKDNDFTEAHNGSNKSHLMSPAWVYNKINYGVDSGSNWYRNHALISSVGNADWDTMPYDWRDLISWGDEDAWRIAPKYRVKSTYDLASTSSTMVIKAWLAEGYILPMAFDANQYTYLSDDDIISSVEYNSGTTNHANTIVGYNDSVTADGEAGAFKIVNSWGATWSTDGYWWMTYDALAELYWPVMRMYDYVDYEPQLIGVLNQSTPASKDSAIRMGTASGDYPDRQPYWTAGTRPYPEFMCLDITELRGDVGLADFFLYYGKATTTGTLSDFRVEWYPDGYDVGNPGRVAISPDTPKQAPSTVHAAFRGIHVDQTSPANGTWHRGDVTVKGTADPYVERTLLSEDFEGRWMEVWTTEDGETAGGLDTWGTTQFRKHAGDKSAYCAGSDAGIVLYEDFDENGFLPADWSVSSQAVDKQPWAVKNSGYQGCGGSDYLVATRSDGGASFNNTELLYTSGPANASTFENLTLSFYVEYNWKDGDEYLKVLYADESTYPNWTVLDTYTSDTFGYQTYDLGAMDGEERVYLGFEYHGTDDLYATIDDVLVRGDKTTHDPQMQADMYIAIGDLAGYDDLVLSYQHWVDSETGVDEMASMYRTSSSSPWQFLINHSGPDRSWVSEGISVPTNASHIGFRFVSDGANESEGAYLDEVVLMGRTDLSTVEVSVDGGSWDKATAGANWSYLWNTTSLKDGRHDIEVRVNYSDAYDLAAFHLMTDNSPPEVSAIWNDPVTTGDPTEVHVTASDPNGVDAVRLIYSFNARPEVAVNVTDMDNGTWTAPLTVPDDGIEMAYRFTLVDTLGNLVETDLQELDVVDNDDPLLGEDDSPDGATTGDIYTFSVTGRDNVGVYQVQLEYWYGDDEASAVTFVTDGDKLLESIDVLHVLSTISYRYTVTDTSGNTVTSPVRNVTIVDNDLPEFGPDGTPSEATTGGNVTMTITASDNIELVGVWVEHRFGDGEAENVSLEEDPDGNYSLTVEVPWDSLEPLRYVFRSLDSSGNWNSTPEVSVTVIDDFMPWFGEDATPGEATTGDPIAFTVDLFDNIGIGRAWVEYWYGNESHTETELTDGNGLTWTGDPRVRDTYLSIWYVIHIQDTWGNHNVTDVRRVIVMDDDAPFILDDGSPAQTTTGVGYTFMVEVQDNLDVERVTVTYWFGEGEPVNSTMSTQDGDANGNGTYRSLITIPNDSTAPLVYHITVTDATGNSNSTDERTVTVLDVKKPVAVAGPDQVIDQHQEVTFDPEGSSDNVGISTWTWSLTDVDGNQVLDGPEPTYTFHEAGVYTVKLTVKDPSGNSASDTMDVTVRDVTDPVPHAGSDRTVDQNTTVFLDGIGSTDNVAINSWTWTFVYDGAQKELAGQDAQFYFVTPGIYQVTLRVVDKAGNDASTSINITVRDTIDPVPVTPKDRDADIDSRIKFDGSRSSDNVGIVNWTWIVEEPSGRVVEVYGEVAEYVPDEPGDYEVTLVVADEEGNTVTADPFTVHVPNVRLWLTLIILVVGSVVATTAIAVHTRRRTLKMDQERRSGRI